MKRSIYAFMVLIGLFLGPSLLAQAVDSADLNRCSHDPSVIAALTMLENTSANVSVNYMVDNNVRVEFENLGERFGATYRNHDALSFITDSNEQIIFISARHHIAPPQALAAIISHEVMHNDRENSIQEERVAWRREAQTWRELRSQYPELANYSIGQSALVDRENAILVLETQQRLDRQVETNVAYQGLPAHSTGY